MKTLTLFVILIFASLAGRAQYVPLLTDSTRWVEIDIFTNTIEVSSDTVINGFQYKNLSGFNLPRLREDTASRKVYYLWPDSVSEAILYDFSLTEGDSIFLNYSLANGFQNPYDAWYIVDTVLYPLIEGTTRKMLVLVTQNLNGPNNYYYGYNCFNCILWIEGIGSTNRLFHLADGVIIGNNPYLSCVFLGNSLIYKYSPLSTCTVTGINEEEVEKKIIISVNNSEINIINESAFKIEAVRVSDLTGRIFYRQEDISVKNFKISGILENSSESLLILNLYLSNGKVISRKILN